MAFEFRGGVLLQRGPAEAAADIRHKSPDRRSLRDEPGAQPKQPYIQPRNVGPGEGPKQALPCRPMQLEFPTPRALSKHARRRHFGTSQLRQEDRESLPEEEGGPGRLPRWRRPEMPALRHGQDAAVADWAHGPENALQCVRGPVQVRAAGAGVSACCEPNVYADKALQLTSEGDGASAPEGGYEGPASAAVHSPSGYGVRCIQR